MKDKNRETELTTCRQETKAVISQIGAADIRRAIDLVNTIYDVFSTKYYLSPAKEQRLKELIERGFDNLQTPTEKDEMNALIHERQEEQQRKHQDQTRAMVEEFRSIVVTPWQDISPYAGDEENAMKMKRAIEAFLKEVRSFSLTEDTKDLVTFHLKSVAKKIETEQGIRSLLEKPADAKRESGEAENEKPKSSKTKKLKPGLKDNDKFRVSELAGKTNLSTAYISELINENKIENNELEGDDRRASLSSLRNYMADQAIKKKGAEKRTKANDRQGLKRDSQRMNKIR